MSFKRFDVTAELQNLGYPPAKVAKPAKVSQSVVSEPPNFSNFSRFSRGEPPKLKKAETIPDTASESWPCPKCGREAEIEAVEPSPDGHHILTYWHCEPCQSCAVTPDVIRQPPKEWATKTRQ